MVSITELLHNWQPMKLKQGTELVLNNSAMLEVSTNWGGLQKILICLFQYLYKSHLLGCISYGTPCISNCEDLAALYIEIM